MFSKIVLIAIFAAVFCQLSQQNPISGPDYSRCDEDDQCFGLPDSKCVKSKSCDVLLKTQAQEKTGDVEFELFWVRPSNASDSWVAAALSADQMMGDDSATVFTIDSKGVVKDMEGLTFVVKGKSAGVKPFTVKGISIQTEKYTNGLLHAKWIRTQNTTVDKMNFDMKANKYYILLAYGPVDDKGQMKHHTHQGMSDNAVNLEKDTIAATTAPTTTAKATTTAPTTAPTAKPTGSSTKTTGTATQTTSTPGNSTGTPSKTSGTPGKSTTVKPKTTTKGPTGHPKTTPKGKGNASTITLSLFVTIFAAILLFLN